MSICKNVVSILTENLGEIASIELHVDVDKFLLLAFFSRSHCPNCCRL